MSDIQLAEFRHPLPSQLADRQIVAAIRIPAREGEVPDLAIVIVWDPTEPYARAFTVWDAAVRDEEWVAFTGDYDLSYDDAIDEFARRIRAKGLGHA